MVSPSYRRLIALFLVAVLLPCAVLVALSVRSLRQERELAQKRRSDERGRLAGQLRQALLTRLETVKSEEVRALVAQGSVSSNVPRADSAVRLVAALEGTHLRLPWERQGGTARQGPANGGASAAALRRGEQEEFARNDASKALASYLEAVQAATSVEQLGEARLALARALNKLARPAEATQQYRALLGLPSDVSDKQGVPLALYAAARLARTETRAVLARVASEARESCCLPPEALYLLRELADTIQARAADPAQRARVAGLMRLLESRIRQAEQARALQAGFAGLGLGSAGDTTGAKRRPSWMLYGSEQWFVTTASLPGSGRRAVLAVDGRTILDDVNRTVRASSGTDAELRLLAAGDAPEPLMATAFPGLTLGGGATSRSSGTGEGSLARTVYAGTLLMVLGVTLFGAYLLWRDVRREMRLAETRSHFVSSVSHELKTPLTAIRMFAETLLLERSADATARREYLETIVSESERLTRLLNNVLDLAKIERGQKVYRFEQTELTEIVRRSARTMQYPLQQQGFRLRLTAADGLPPVSADADAIEQAILNLLTNAMKYSGESREIDLRLRRQDSEAIVEVTDRGVGIPPAERLRIVGKFYRVSTPENARIPGSGLGLTLVEHVANAHGGRLEIESEVGRGSTFAIHLPLGDRT